MEFANELKKLLAELAGKTFKCYIIDGTDYGYIITNNDNVLYIYRDGYKWRGWDIALQYVPSKKNGSGCRCNDEPMTEDFIIENIDKIERDGLNFARKLKAELYKNSEQYFKNYWQKDKMIEVK